MDMMVCFMDMVIKYESEALQSFESTGWPDLEAKHQNYVLRAYYMCCVPKMYVGDLLNACV